MKSQVLQKRFESKVTYVPFCGCHLWSASVNNFGYGKFGIYPKWVLAHRYAWELENGPIPEGKCVLHHCDTPSCVNSKHMYIGDKRDNAQDREKRNRSNHPTALKHHKTKLMPSQVHEIRDLFDTGKYSFYKLGKIYGIDGKSVANIIDRRVWTSVH